MSKSLDDGIELSNIHPTMIRVENTMKKLWFLKKEEKFL